MSKILTPEDLLLRWAARTSPGEVARREEWLRTAEVPTLDRMEALTSAAPPVRSDLSELDARRLDLAIDSMTDFLLAERVENGSFLLTDRQVYMNLLLFILDGLNTTDLEDGFQEWRSTW